MAAGLGFKDFQTGEVLTAADVDGYLMQNIWVFASAAARDAAVTAPSEGNFAYLKDTNTTTYYTGSAWTNLDTTGMVNPMTTTGDTIYSSSGSTPARLGIGTTGQVLTVAAGVPSWATPSAGGGGKVLQVVAGTSSTISTSTSSSYQNSNLSVSITPTLNTSKVLILVSQTLAKSSSASNTALKWRLMRDSTEIFVVGDNLLQTSNTTELNMVFPLNYLDSPATTSATTYKTQIASANSTSSIKAQDSASSTIIALEIGA
jgi:hypothetical protein